MYCSLLFHTPRVLKVASCRQFSSYVLVFTHSLSPWGRIAGVGVASRSSGAACPGLLLRRGSFFCAKDGIWKTPRF